MLTAIFQGRWTTLEQEKFLHAISMKNLSWKEIAEMVGTRTAAQCKSHHQKLFKTKNNEKVKSKATKADCNKRGADLICKEIQCDSTDGSSTEPNTPQLVCCGEGLDSAGEDKGTESVEMTEFFDECFDDEVLYF